MNLETALNKFLQDRQVYCSPASMRYYRETLNYFLDYCYIHEVTDVWQLDRDIMKEFALYLRMIRKIKATSIHTYFRAVYAFCSYLIEEELIDDFKYKIKLPRENPTIVLPLTQEEVKAIKRSIFKHSNDAHRDLLIFTLMLDCGLRSSEVRNLRISDFDKEKSLIKIVESKFDKSRLVPVPKVVDSYMKYYLPHRAPSGSAPASDYLLLSRDGKQLTANAIKQLFYKIKCRSGVTRLHAHLLRHTFATSYMCTRNNIEFLRMYLGHESYAVTQGYVKLAAQCALTGYDIYIIDVVFR